MPNRFSQRILWLVMLMLLFVGLAGITQLDAEFINIDELSAFGNMGGFDPPYSPVQIIDSILDHSPDHVPLWFLFAAGFAQLTGWSQVALRLVSVLTSLLVCASVYHFTACRFGRKTAVIALLLLVTNAYFLQYSYRILMYPLLMLLAILHSHLYFRLAYRKASSWTFLAFILTASAIIYTHAFGALILVGLGFHHFLFVAKSRRWAALLAAWMVAGSLFFPYLPRLFRGYEFNLKSETSATVLDVLALLANEFVNGQPLLCLPLLLALAFPLTKRRHNLSILPIIHIGLAGLVAYLLLKLVLGEVLISRIRYFFSIWFVMIIPFAYGLAFAPRWFLVPFLLAWSVAFIVDLPQSLFPPPSGHTLFRTSALKSLSSSSAPADIFIGAFGEADSNTKRGLHNYSMVDYTLRQLGLDSIRLKMRRSPAEIESQYRSIFTDYGRFLLGFQPSSPPAQLPYLLEFIESDYAECATLLGEPTMTVVRFADRDIGCDHKPVPTPYENGLVVQDRFARFFSERQQIKVLTWIETADARQELEHNVSWQVLTMDWQNVRQVDKHLHDSTVLPWSRIEISTEGLPSDHYRVMLILYRSDTGEKINYLDPATRQSSAFLPVLEFAITEDAQPN